MRIHTKFKLAAVTALLGLTLSGCYHHGHRHGGYRERDPVVDACLVGMCVGSTYLGPRTHPAVAVAAGATAAAIYLAAESGHHHGHHCGCQSRWYSGYRAYYWHGHWEYHDGRSWYIVEEERGPGW